MLIDSLRTQAESTEASARIVVGKMALFYQKISEDVSKVRSHSLSKALQIAMKIKPSSSTEVL